MFSPGINLVIGSFVFMLMPIFVAGRYHPSLVLVPVVFIILYFIFLVRYLKTLSPVTDEVRSAFGVMNTHLSESLDGVEVVKGASQENAEVDRFVMNASRFRNAFVKQGDLEGRYIAMLLLGSAYAFGLFHALLLFRSGQINIGDVVAFFQFAYPASIPNQCGHVCLFANFIGRLQRTPHPGIDQPRNKSRPERAGPRRSHQRRSGIQKCEF